MVNMHACGLFYCVLTAEVHMRGVAQALSAGAALVPHMCEQRVWLKETAHGVGLCHAAELSTLFTTLAATSCDAVGSHRCSARQEKNSPEGLVGVARRFVKFGGALGEAQMAWLRAELAEAAGLGERVIVCCHLVQPCSEVTAGQTAYLQRGSIVADTKLWIAWGGCMQAPCCESCRAV